MEEPISDITKNVVVTRQIPRLDRNIIKDISTKSKGGRKKRYSPTKMKNGINNYFEQCEKTDEIPSIKGMMIFLKMYKDQYYTYLEYPEFTEMLEHARLIISNWIENDIYRTKGLAAGKIAYAKNLHSWSDKVEQTNTVTQRVINVDEARAKIEMLAPKLLELLKNTSLVNQLAIAPAIEAEIITENRL
jgi:hypothetical protein